MENRIVEYENRIIQAEKNINKSTFEIGECLYIINKEKLYKEKCYSSFVDYVENEMHMKKTQAYNYIECFNRFGNDENKEKYKDFNVSQLILLNNASDDLIDEVTPDMSVSEIKKKIKEIYKDDNEITYEDYVSKEIKKIIKYVSKKYKKSKDEFYNTLNSFI